MFRPYNGALRLCAHPGCGAPATAVLTFQYASGTVWVLDLGEPDPAAIDLCTRHADKVSAPRGWTSHDRRAGSGSSMSTSVAS
jgi:streptogramin lyase